MSHFVFWGEDRADGLADRLRVRDEHRAWLRTHPHPVTCLSGGPWLNAQGDMAGSMLVIEAESIDAVAAYLAEDPYAKVGLFKSSRIQPFVWGLGQPGGES